MRGAKKEPPVSSEGFRSGFVALAGRPNVGKSTLLNRLIGSKVSIVSPVSQTTRSVVRAVDRSPHAEVVYLDTPGVHRPRFRMNREMVRAAREALENVDLVLLLVAAPDGLGPGDAYMIRLLEEAKPPAFLVINKIDAVAREKLLPWIDQASRRHAWEEIFPCSALTGEGCEALSAGIRKRMPIGQPLFPEEFLSDLPVRLALAERIREQVLLRTREEIPHSTAVLVEEIRRDEKGEYRVSATLLVDRESQKGILIGRGGEMLKSVGQAARREMASYLEAPVHLSLWVKVKKNWRDDPSMLRLLGIATHH
jgi:GTP-binding protein Era